MESHSEIVSFLAKYLELSELDPMLVAVERMVGFSNDVFKITIDDSVRSEKLSSNTLILKQKVKDCPNADFILLSKTVPTFLKKYDLGPQSIFEDGDCVIFEYIPSTTCTLEDFKTVETYFDAIKQLGEYCKLFANNPQEYQALNMNKTLLAHILDKGIVERSLTKMKQIFASPEANVDKSGLESIIHWLESTAFSPKAKEVIEEGNKQPMIICHNDFYWLNVLKKNSGGVMLIDYEYTAFNPLGWDIANYYTERNFRYNKETHAFDYVEDLPSFEERSLVYKYYLLCLGDSFDSSTPVDAQFIFDLTSGKYNHLIDEDELSRLSDAQYFTKLCFLVNLQWILFNCIMLDEDPTWPLIEYTLHRIELHSHFLNNLASQKVLEIK
jgi:thiamine kinase-like enzyme